MNDSIRREADARMRLARDVIVPRLRELNLQWFQSPDLASESKADGSVVTPIDRESEDIIRAILAREFPDDAVLGEERGDTPARDPANRWRWVLDPIDGTASFVRGLPHWVVLIGIEHDHVPVAGVIDVPALGETLSAHLGGGAWWTKRSGQPVPAQVSHVGVPDCALIELGSARNFRKHSRAAIHDRLCETVKRTRGWSDGYAFVLLATGRVDAAVNFGFHRWDLCAPAIIIREAGGEITDWTGRDDLDGSTMLATNARLHPTMLSMLA